MRRLLWYLAIFVLLIGIVFAKKNVNNDAENADSDTNGGNPAILNSDDESTTRRQKGLRGHKRPEAINDERQLTNVEVPLEKSTPDTVAVSTEETFERRAKIDQSTVENNEPSTPPSEPIESVENNVHALGRNKTKTKPLTNDHSDQQNNAEKTVDADDGTAVVPANESNPPVIGRDRSVGIPDHVESEFPQKNFEGAPKVRRRIKVTLTPQDELPVVKHDEFVVETHTVTPSAKKRRTTTKSPDEEDDYKPEDFHILTGIPPEDLDFRNPTPKSTLSTSTSTTTTSATTTTTTTAPTTTTTTSSQVDEDKPAEVQEGKGGRKTHPRRPTLPVPVEIDDETPEGFHILTGIPDDKEETEESFIATTPRPAIKVKGNTPEGFHILTGIPDDVKKESTEDKILVTKPNAYVTTPSDDEEYEDETQKFHILTGIPPDFAGQGNVEEETSTEPPRKSLNKHTPKITTQTPEPIKITTPLQTTPEPTVVVTTPIHPTKSKKGHKQRTRGQLESSKLVATDADFGKAVNSKFNSIVRNLSSTGLLTDKDLLSERVIKNISDSFAELIQQSLLNRDSSEPLNPTERELILDGSANKVINMFKASRSTILHMEKRQHGSVVDFDTTTDNLESHSSDPSQLSEIESSHTTFTTSPKNDISTRSNKKGRGHSRPIPGIPLREEEIDPDKESTDSAFAATKPSISFHSANRQSTDSSAEEVESTDSPLTQRPGSRPNVAGIAGSETKETTNKDQSSISQQGASTVATIHKRPSVTADSSSEFTDTSDKSLGPDSDSEESTQSINRDSTRIISNGEETTPPSVSSKVVSGSGFSNVRALGTKLPDLLEKKHQTPNVRFQVGADVTLEPGISGHPELSEFGLANSTNEFDGTDSTSEDEVERESTIAREQEDVKTHFITRGPITFKTQSRSEPSSSEESINDTSVEPLTSFPNPPDFTLSSDKENESIFAGYRTKPVPQIESGEENTTGLFIGKSEITQSEITSSTQGNTAVGLIFLLTEVTGSHNSSELTTKSSLSGTSISEESEEVIEESNSTTKPSTANFGITYRIDIVNSTANYSSPIEYTAPPREQELNETTTSKETSKSLSIVVLSVNNVTSSSSNNSSEEEFETSDEQVSFETTPKQSTNASAFGINLSSETTSSSETSKLSTPVESTINTTLSTIALVEISGFSNSPNLENTTGEFSVEPGLVTANINKSNAAPEPEWTKSTDNRLNISSERTGVPEPEWTKSTTNESVEFTKPTDNGLPVTVSVNSVSQSVSDITTRPANPYIATWTFKFNELEWDSSLNDKTSWQYKQLLGKVEPELTKIFKELLKEKFVSILIKRFSSGSVIVNGQTEITDKVDTSQLEDSFRTYMRGQSFAIAGDTIDPASIRIEGLGDTALQTATNPSSVSTAGASGGVPGYVIGIIVAVIILVLVVIAIALYLRKYRNRHHGNDYMANQENGNGKTWQNPQQPQPQQRVPTNGRDQYAGLNMYEMKDVPPPHGHVNQGYQTDGRTNGYSASTRNVAEIQSSLDENTVTFEDESSSH